MIQTSTKRDTAGTDLESMPTVALMPWGNVIEDFLDPTGISLDAFLGEFRGSWMFGYIDALSRAGVRTVIIAPSVGVSIPTRCIHVPTGAPITLLPVSGAYRAMRRLMIYPYGQSVRHVFGELRGARRPLRPLYWLLKEVAYYLPTPLGALGRELRHYNCDAILCQEYEYPRFDLSVLLGNLLRIPVFASFQGGNYRTTFFERLTRPLAIRGAAGLIVGSDAETERVRARYGLPVKRMAQIFNPVDLDTWRPVDRAEARAELGIPTNARVVAWHGRVSLHKKGLDILVKAWEQVRREHPELDARLLLIGSADDAAGLKRLLSSAGREDVLWIDEFVNDPEELRRYLSAADVYAFPSRYEGFPVAPIEAMACGLPVVATAVDGIRDILEGGERSGGLVVPVENEIALAHALGSLLEDLDRARALGQLARARVESRFGPQLIGEQLRRFMFGSENGS